MSFVRISLGRFDASMYDTVRQKLVDSQKTLAPAMKALTGNVAFYAGIDRENSTLSNVSVWASLKKARQMDSLNHGRAGDSQTQPGVVSREFPARASPL